MSSRLITIKQLIIAIILFSALVSCNNPTAPEYDTASEVPLAPSVSSNHRGNSGWIYDAEDLGNARKEYIEVFFRLMEREKKVAAFFFPPNSVLNVTSYDPDRVPLAGQYEGTIEVFQYLSQLFKQLDIDKFDIRYQLADGDYLSTHAHLLGEVISTGVEIDMHFVFLFKFQSYGPIAECRVYYDTQVWTRAFTATHGDSLSDIRNPFDDNQILDTEFDVEAQVQEVYDNFYGGNIPAVLELLSPSAAVYFKGDQETYPYAGVYQGIPEILQFIKNLAGTAVPYNIEMFSITEGDRTDVVLFEEWTVFATEKSYHVNTVNSWRVGSDGLLLGFSNYPDSLEIEQAYIP